jgi:P27 family predicted phage terminase small subunit
LRAGKEAVDGGTPAQTNHLRLLQGNPGKRALNSNEPRPPAQAPEIPPHLNEEARAEWNRMSVVLLRVGLLSTIDRAAFSAYCGAWSRWVEAEDALKKSGTVVKAPSGYPIISPYLVISNRAMEQMRAFISEFGLSPSARSRISVNIHEAEDSFEQWIQKGS